MSRDGGEGGGCHLPCEASKVALGIDRLSAQQEGAPDDPIREVLWVSTLFLLRHLAILHCEGVWATF